MQRAFVLAIVFLTVLVTFTKGAPIEEENDPDLMKRNWLLEKLGMELHRDPLAYRRDWGRKGRRSRSRRRRGRRGSGHSSSGNSSGYTSHYSSDEE